MQQRALARRALPTPLLPPALAHPHRGRGNAFLNDLCDADVLVHVVDVSGSTDREGAATQEGEGADPLDEIGWAATA
jgi:ribosome-binding ATPase YchF (GTP1/OBG family)